MYADIQNYGVNLSIIGAYRKLIIRENEGYYYMVCTTDLHSVSELRSNTKILVIRRRDIGLKSHPKDRRSG